MSNVTYIADHEDQAVARLVAQFKDKPLIEGVLRAFIKQIQDIEDVLNVMINETLENAEGVQLDGFGEIVGEKRNGKTDEFYRIAILARTGRNTSEGTPEDIISVFNLLTGSTETHLIEYDAVITLTGNVDFSENALLIKNYVQKVLAAGVRLDYIAQAIQEPPFAFEGFPGGAGFDEGYLIDAF